MYMEHLSINVKDIFRWIDDKHKKNIDEFMIDSLSKEYYEVEDNDFINGNINYDDSFFLREYSGFNYKHINNALRGKWNYEENGHIDNKERFIKDGERVFDIIENNPSYSTQDFRVYRGVTLSYFREYGINSLDDLIRMKGQFMYDQAFVSTSIKEKDSFFKKDNNLGLNYNVMITYLISKEFDDGIFLYGDRTYTGYEKEYLINKGNISKVVSVNINEDGTANLTAVMIPKRVYDDYYAYYKNSEKSR